MNRMTGVDSLLAALAFSSLCLPLLADDVQSGTDGNQIVPIDSKAIRMASERVDVDVTWPVPKGDEDTSAWGGRADTHVVASFELVNETDEAQSILVSFPGAFDVKGFARTVDGKPVKVEEHRGAKYGNASKIDFAPRQTHTVHVEYEGDTTETSGFNYLQQWSYIITTGAHWKGKIGQAVVTIHFPKDMPLGGKGPFNIDAITMTPADYYYNTKGRTATWMFEDFEPAEDISIKWSRYDALLASDPFKLASKKEASALLLEQGQQLELRKALAAFAAIREFFPDSAEAKTLDYHIASAFSRESHEGKLSTPYAKEAIARYEAALKQPIDTEQREAALCKQFVLCCTETGDRDLAKTLLGRIKKEELDSQAAAALTEWARDRLFAADDPREAIKAYDTIRELLPDSSQAKTIDCNIAYVYAHHYANERTAGELACACYITDAAKAVTHYEVALKQPLQPAWRQYALAELLILYASEVPDADKAETTYGLLKDEKIDPHERQTVLKVAAVSPAKALALVDNMSEAPERANEVANLRGDVQALLKANPDGILARKASPQTQPASNPTTQPRMQK